MWKTWNIHHITECFFSVFRNIHRRLFFVFFRTWSFTLSKNDLDPNDNSNSVSSSPMMNCCGLAPLWGQNNGCPPFYHPSIHQLSTLEKTKLCHRPILSSVLGTSFQRIFCGGALTRDLCHGQQLVSPFLSYSSAFALQGTLTFITFLPRAFWCRRWQSWGSPCNQTHHWPWLCCDSFFTWVFLCFFSKSLQDQNWRTEMANVWTNTKRWFHSSRVKFSLG